MSKWQESAGFRSQVVFRTILFAMVTQAGCRQKKPHSLLETQFTLNSLRIALRNLKDHYRHNGLLGRKGEDCRAQIRIDWELDPYNESYGWNGSVVDPAWPEGWRPRLNLRCGRFYTPRESRISEGRLVDSWGNPYVYDIITRQRDLDGDGIAETVDVEMLYSKGPDGILDTDDDIMVEVDRRVRSD